MSDVPLTLSAFQLVLGAVCLSLYIIASLHSGVASIRASKS